MNARRVQDEMGVFMRKRAGAIRYCGRKDDIVHRFRAEEERIRGCARMERSIFGCRCELEHPNRPLLFKSGLGAERAGGAEERSYLLQCQRDGSPISLAQLRINMEMRAADQCPSALGSTAAERHKNSQHQNGNVLHVSNDSRDCLAPNQGSVKVVVGRSVCSACPTPTCKAYDNAAH